MSYEGPLTLLADGDKTPGSGTDNVCDLKMVDTRSGLPLEDSVHPSETLCANLHVGEISNSHEPDYAMQKKKTNHEMKCNDKQDIHVSLACDHTSTVATSNVVPSTPSIHVQGSELQSIVCGIDHLGNNKESYTIGCNDEQINSAVGTDEEHDAELEEDQAALDHRQELTGDALPCMMQFNSLENCIYQCAPMKTMFLDISCWMTILKFWPSLISFHMAERAYHTEDRTTNLPICKYFSTEVAEC